MFEEKKGSSHSSYRPGFEKVTSFDAQTYVEKPKKVKQHPNKHPELDRLNRALKNGRITPLAENTRNKLSMSVGPAKAYKEAA
jgi:hypothetical protein